MKPFFFPAACSRRNGFTLVEIMIVVAIIALIVAIALPNLALARQTAQRTRLLKLVKETSDGFTMYEADNQKLPLQTASASMAISTAGIVPPGMNLYLPQNNTWTTGTDGTWYWVYWPNGRPGYNGFVYLLNPNITDDDIAFIDSKIDDGNTQTGALINYGGTGLIYSLQ